MNTCMNPSTLLPTKNKFFVRQSFQRLNVWAVYYLLADKEMMMLLECPDQLTAQSIAMALNNSQPRSHSEIQREIIQWIGTARQDDSNHYLNGYIIGLIRGLLWANGFGPLTALDIAEGIVKLVQKAV